MRRRPLAQVAGQHDHAVCVELHAHIMLLVCRQQLREDHAANASEHEVMPIDCPRVGLCCISEVRRALRVVPALS